MSPDADTLFLPPLFILGSASPRRRQLLEQAGYSFRVESSAFDEKGGQFSSESPWNLPRQYAIGKAHSLCSRFPEEWILTADTVVVLGGSLLEKPGSETEAYTMLCQLSGTTHEVITAVVWGKGATWWTTRVHTQVTFRTLGEHEIEHYIRHYAPFDKAGSYGIQEWLGLRGVTSIHGCYYNVVGLPVAATGTLIVQGCKNEKSHPGDGSFIEVIS